MPRVDHNFLNSLEQSRHDRCCSEQHRGSCHYERVNTILKNIWNAMFMTSQTLMMSQNDGRLRSLDGRTHSNMKNCLVWGMGSISPPLDLEMGAYGFSLDFRVRACVRPQLYLQTCTD